MGARIAVEAAQKVLKASSDKSLVVDGQWGAKSEKAYVQSDGAVQAAADRAAASFGYPLDDIRGVSRARFLVSPSRMEEVISKVSAETGIASSVLKRFVDLEAARQVVAGERWYVADAINRGGYRGLFQFDSKGHAWAQAAKDGPLPPFSEWRDAYANTLAAARYLRINSRYLRAKGYTGEITGSIAYLMHNQGAAGALGILRGTRRVEGAQSAAALLVVREAISDFKSRA